MTRDHQNLIAASPHASNSELARAIGCDPKTVAAFRQWRDANNNKGGAGVWYGESRLDAKQEPVYCPECHCRLTRAFRPFARRDGRLFSAEPCTACWVRAKPQTSLAVEEEDEGLAPEVAVAAAAIRATWQPERLAKEERYQPAVVQVVGYDDLHIRMHPFQVSTTLEEYAPSEWVVALKARHGKKRTKGKRA